MRKEILRIFTKYNKSLIFFISCLILAYKFRENAILMSIILTVPFLLYQIVLFRDIIHTKYQFHVRFKESLNFKNLLKSESPEGDVMPVLQKLLGRNASITDIKQIIISDFDDYECRIRTNTNLVPAISLLCDFLGLGITLVLNNKYIATNIDMVLYGFIPIVVPSIIGLVIYVYGSVLLRDINDDIDNISNVCLREFLEVDKEHFQENVTKVKIEGQDELNVEFKLFSETMKDLNIKFKGFDRVFTGHIGEFGKYTEDIKAQQEKFILSLASVFKKISEKQEALLDKLSESSINSEKRNYELLQEIKSNTNLLVSNLTGAINSLVEGIKPLATFKDQIDTLNTQIENSTSNLNNTSRNANNLTEIVNNSLKEINIVTSELSRFNTSIDGQINYISEMLKKYDSQNLQIQKYFENLDKVNAVKESLDTLTNSISIPLDTISSNLTKDLLKEFTEKLAIQQNLINQQNDDIKRLIENFNKHLEIIRAEKKVDSNKSSNEQLTNTSVQGIIEKLDEIKDKLPSKWKVWPFNKREKK